MFYILVSADVHDPTMCQLNFVRLVLLYIKNFELSNVNYALNYSFFLRKFELDNIVDSTGLKNNTYFVSFFHFFSSTKCI